MGCEAREVWTFHSLNIHGIILAAELKVCDHMGMCECEFLPPNWTSKRGKGSLTPLAARKVPKYRTPTVSLAARRI